MQTHLSYAWSGYRDRQYIRLQRKRKAFYGCSALQF